MTTILFPSIPSNSAKLGLQMRFAYAVILTDVVRGCSDAIDALMLFDDLLHQRNSDAQSLGFMAFDAHGGDTGCQLRAGMVLDLWTSQRRTCTNPSTGLIETPSWIVETVSRLRQLQEKCRFVCAQLTQKRIKPEVLGLGKSQDTATNIVAALGWSEFCEPSVLPLDQLSLHSDSDLADTSSDDADSDDGQHSPIFSSSSSITPCTSPSVSEKDCDSDIDWPIQTRWSMTNSATMIRFIVYAFVLSKYKKFCRLDNIVGARVEPELAAHYGLELMNDCLNPKNGDYKAGKTPRIGLEMRVMQEWLSDYSCAWIRSLSERSFGSIDLGPLIASTIQKSAKAITATACYPAWLLQREYYGRAKASMVFIDRYFCSHGWHFNVFEAEVGTPIEVSNAHPNAGGFRVAWKISRTSIDELIVSPERDSPRVILMGNSIVGSYAGYMDRVPQAGKEQPQNSKVHRDVCSENEQHTSEFVEADLDRLLLGFFASHKIYAFPLVSGEDEDDFIDRSFGELGEDDCLQSIKESWKISSAEADKIGGGRGGIHMFGLQHMFTETGPRVAARLKVWEDRDDVMLLSAGCAYTD